MARTLRLEAEDGIYHVLNRGNYRADIFRADKTKAAFLTCLGEACGKAGWRVHAWCIMSNHYHLAVETPQGNLVGGMQWLQGTFSTRFNRLRGERGHLFQGRYKSLLVDPTDRGLDFTDRGLDFQGDRVREGFTDRGLDFTDRGLDFQGDRVRLIARVPQLEQEVKIVSEESGISSGAVYEES